MTIPAVAWGFCSSRISTSSGESNPALLVLIDYQNPLYQGNLRTFAFIGKRNPAFLFIKNWNSLYMGKSVHFFPFRTRKICCPKQRNGELYWKSKQIFSPSRNPLLNKRAVVFPSGIVCGTTMCLLNRHSSYHDVWEKAKYFKRIEFCFVPRKFYGDARVLAKLGYKGFQRL